MSSKLFAPAALPHKKQTAVVVIIMPYDNSVCSKIKSIGVVKGNKWFVLWELLGTDKC